MSALLIDVLSVMNYHRKVYNFPHFVYLLSLMNIEFYKKLKTMFGKAISDLMIKPIKSPKTPNKYPLILFFLNPFYLSIIRGLELFWIASNSAK